MLSVTNKSGPYVAPQVDSNPSFEEAKKSRSGAKEDFDFDKMIGESNTAIAAQMEADKKSVGANGELKIGENKSDKEFREMLERVTGRKQDKLKNKLDKDDYLNLMVTQLKYQDPTKPLENHEMATQLAQFNTVEQLINVNKSLTDMANKSAQANIEKLTPYLGKMIEVDGAKMKVGTDQTVTQGSVELGAPSGSVSVLIKDGTGTVVRTMGLGEKDTGRHAINWDGKTDGGIVAKPGEYTFEVQASSVDGKEMKVKTSFMTRVDAITDLASGGKLETASGTVEAKDILAIRPDHTPLAQAAATPAVSTSHAAAQKAYAQAQAAIQQAQPVAGQAQATAQQVQPVAGQAQPTNQSAAQPMPGKTMSEKKAERREAADAAHKNASSKRNENKFTASNDSLKSLKNETVNTTEKNSTTSTNADKVKEKTDSKKAI